jgi:hypothetical protein
MQPLDQQRTVVAPFRIREPDGLYGDSAPDQGIFGGVHHAHSPAAQFMKHIVSAYLCHDSCNYTLNFFIYSRLY